jgi:hypothetical protein
MKMNEIWMISILDYDDTPPSVFATFWWSEGNGLTCDNPRLFELVAREGIILSNSLIVFPRDGKKFFDALPSRFNGVRSAQPAIKVDSQGGRSV